MPDKPRERKEIQESVTNPPLGKDFHPSKADMEKEFDMPELSLDEISVMPFRSFKKLREDS